jgi:ABC-type nitrate/sulfonate/bicarbonate transport system substrate-binding protein
MSSTIALTDDKMGYQLVTRQDIKKAGDLKGKRFGISRFGSSSDFSTKVLLKKIGVDPKEVTILQIGNETQRLVALKSGGIDGSIFNAPFGAEAKKSNFNILADAGALNIPYFNTGMCGSTQMMQKNETRMLNFLRAYLEAIKIFKTETEYTLKALSQFSKVNEPRTAQRGIRVQPGANPGRALPLARVNSQSKTRCHFFRSNRPGCAMTSLAAFEQGYPQFDIKRLLYRSF